LDINLITTFEDLQMVCQKALNDKVIAIDTEFKRETTYFPKACLIQISSENVTACIDPLMIEDLAPLKEILFSPKIIKIFHAARQDLEIFYFLFDAIPKPIFDTQIAATLLGFADQVGYATLAKKMLHVELDKSLTRADWEKRPIPQKQLEYAANDVIYLLQIYQQQIEGLNNTGRLKWLEKDFDFLCSEELYKPAPDNAWKKIKNYNRMTHNQRCIVYKISQWRENIALQRNRPRTFIIKNQSIIDLANQQPRSLEELKDIRDIHPSIIKRDGKKILELIGTAGKMDTEECPQTKKPKILSEAQNLLLSSLQTVVQINARKHKIDSSYLCTRKELEKVLLNEEDASLLHGWRYELAGKDVLRFLKGELKLNVVNNKLQLSEI